MLTPQEVSARSFTKTMMGGYNMTMVDEFLDELTDDYTSLYKENASLKAKMKVLVEKVEEYRATEDSMRATLLTAQRMADSIVKEAEEKRDGILKQAEAAAREKLDGYRKEAEQYNKRLQQGQEEIRRFVAESRALCEKELHFLEEFPDLPLEEGEPVSAAAEDHGYQVEGDQLVMTKGAPVTTVNWDDAKAQMEEKLQQAFVERFSGKSDAVDATVALSATQSETQEPDFDAIHREV